MRNKLIYICYTFFIVFFVTCKIQVENHSQSSIINSNNKNDVLEVNPIAYHINDSITNIFRMKGLLDMAIVDWVL